MLVSKLTRKEFHRLIENLQIVARELREERQENEKEEKQEEGVKNEN